MEKLNDKPTKRDVFSYCGKLTGHYTVCSWLRPMCGFVKRMAVDGRWDDPADEYVQRLAADLGHRLQAEDPVGRRWCVSISEPAVLWTDSSSLAMGACREIDGSIVEDGTWMRRVNDVAHINVSELEAVLKGIRMAIDWSLTEFELCIVLRPSFPGSTL